MSRTIQISEESADLLVRQAAAHGLTLDAWVERLAHESARAGHGVTTRHAKTRTAAEGLLELQKLVKPDPEGWTSRDYINVGRR